VVNFTLRSLYPLNKGLWDPEAVWTFLEKSLLFLWGIEAVRYPGCHTEVSRCTNWSRKYLTMCPRHKYKIAFARTLAVTILVQM